MIHSDGATQWARWLADYFRASGESNPFLLAAKLGWRIRVEMEEHNDIFVPARLAEWDGRKRTIRIFTAALYRHEGECESALHRACAHELFHGLAASDYHGLPPTLEIPSRLNCDEEETAAKVFAETLLTRL